MIIYVGMWNNFDISRLTNWKSSIIGLDELVFYFTLNKIQVTIHEISFVW